MKKITRILSYEPKPIVEYHLSEDEYQLVQKAVNLVLSSTGLDDDCEDDNGFVIAALDLAKELAEIEFPN